MSDNTFLTNESETNSISERLEQCIKFSSELRILVGFFYFSGWQELYNHLVSNENIILKILVGLKVDKLTSGTVEVGYEANQSPIEYFQEYKKSLLNGLNQSDLDNELFHKQIGYFIDLMEQGKLEIRKTKEPNHGKIYIFEYDDDTKVRESYKKNGRFIIGSSNLTKAGLRGQHELNLEVSDHSYDDAKSYFDNLWDNYSIPITKDDEQRFEIIKLLRERTQSTEVTPFEAYVYMLKTYLELNEGNQLSSSVNKLLEDNGFTVYKYQTDAVNQALNVINNHNGVIIADVVGLGKSVIAGLVANQIGRRGLIISPPGLIGDSKKWSGWYEYIQKFGLNSWDIESSGMVQEVAESMKENDFGYEVVIVDEAHKFRNEDTADYDALLEICRDKKVILLTATPFNNSPSDIFALLKLFLIPGKSGLVLEDDIEITFSAFKNKYDKISYIQKNLNTKESDKKNKVKRYYEGMGFSLPVDLTKLNNESKEMANLIKKTIEPVTIRRNRLDLKNDYEYSKEVENVSVVLDPKEVLFELEPEQSVFYDKILTDYFGADGQFKGAIYTPNEYVGKKKTKLNEAENRTFTQQKNLFDFMKRLLVKRFESSFGAFDKSISRFLKVHKMVLDFVTKSGMYILDRQLIESYQDTAEDMESFDEESIREIFEEFEKRSKSKTSPKHTTVYEIGKFVYKNEFIADIKNDIILFEKIRKEIKTLDLIKNDPKRIEVAERAAEILAAKGKPIRKVIIFTEYTATVEHLKDYFLQKFNKRVLVCDGAITEKFRNELNANFNAMDNKQDNDYDVLITSDKLSEGFNLNRAGAVINYDIPWNPTRVIQRLGRINRIGKKVFEELHIYNIFPTERGEDVNKSREIAQQKMLLIHNALGEDSKIFDVNEEPTPSDLYARVNQNPEDTGEESLITRVRNAYNSIMKNHPNVIESIGRLPNRTKTAKLSEDDNLIVLRKKGITLHALMSSIDGKKVNTSEISFERLLELTRCEIDEPTLKLSPNFWKMYEEAKHYTPPKRPEPVNEKSISNQAMIGLNTLLRHKELNSETKLFISHLLKDIKDYKTISKYALREFIISDTQKGDQVIENIRNYMKVLGTDFMTRLKERTSSIEEDVIISIDNHRGNEEMFGA